MGKLAPVSPVGAVCRIPTIIAPSPKAPLHKSATEHMRMNPQTSPDRLAYGLGDVAEMLSLSIRSIYHLIDAGGLKAVKIGGRRLILREDLDAFMKAAREAA